MVKTIGGITLKYSSVFVTLKAGNKSCFIEVEDTYIDDVFYRIIQHRKDERCTRIFSIRLNEIIMIEEKTY